MFVLFELVYAAAHISETSLQPCAARTDSKNTCSKRVMCIEVACLFRTTLFFGRRLIPDVVLLGVRWIQAAPKILVGSACWRFAHSPTLRCST